MLTSPCAAFDGTTGAASRHQPAPGGPGPGRQARRGTGRLALTAAWALAWVLAAPAAQAAEPAAPATVQLVVWSAGDCGPCRLWHEGERHTEFTTAARAWDVGLVSVRKPSLKDPATAFAWPDPAQLHGHGWVRHLPRPKLLPHFDILCRGRPMAGVAGMSGLGEWDSFWHGRLRQAARDCLASPG